MTGTNFFTPLAPDILVALSNEAGEAVLIKCEAGDLPTDAGYAVGCMAMATDSGAFYTNTGTNAVASFTLISASSVTVPNALADDTTTTGVSLSDTVSKITTGKIIKAINGNAANFTTGAACFYGDMGVATAGNGLVLIGTGAYTGTGLVTLTNNALTTGTALAISATGQTSGALVTIVGGGANVTTGTALAVSLGAATQGTGLSVITSGVYAGSNNLVTITANNATTSTGLLSISATGLTTGTALVITCTEATLTTGKYIQCYDGAANDFTVGKYGATVIAGNAATTVLTITAGNEVVTAGNVVLTAGTIIETPQAIVNANTAVSVTHGVTTIANNGVSAHSLADGVAGQRKTIICTVYAASAVITPANLANGSTITLNAVGDACTLLFLGTEWWVESLYGTAALA